ncbi:MAG: winged helix-turn-helix domain-containing protein, partial [Marmoricola sp.]
GLVGVGGGAHDSLPTRCRWRELVARGAAWRRGVPRPAELVREAGPTPVTVGAVRLDPGARRVWIDGGEIHLTPTEFDLLHTLAVVPGQVLSRERLLAEVWGWDGGAGATRTVDSHVKALRTKIGAERVRTVHGVGYALEER